MKGKILLHVQFKSKNSKIVLIIYTLFVLKSNHHHHLFRLPLSHQRVSFIRSVNGFFFDRQVVATDWTSRSNKIKSHNGIRCVKKRRKKYFTSNEWIKLCNRYHQIIFIFFFNFPPWIWMIWNNFADNANTLCTKKLVRLLSFWIII